MLFYQCYFNTYSFTEHFLKSRLLLTIKCVAVPYTGYLQTVRTIVLARLVVWLPESDQREGFGSHYNKSLPAQFSEGSRISEEFISITAKLQGRHTEKRIIKKRKIGLVFESDGHQSRKQGLIFGYDGRQSQKQGLNFGSDGRQGGKQGLNFGSDSRQGQKLGLNFGSDGRQSGKQGLNFESDGRQGQKQGLFYNKIVIRVEN